MLAMLKMLWKIAFIFDLKKKKKLGRYNIKFIHLNFSYSIIIHLLLFLLITIILHYYYFID